MSLTAFWCVALAGAGAGQTTRATEQTHKDSMGTAETLTRGAVQFMTAGRSVGRSVGRSAIDYNDERNSLRGRIHI